VAPMRGEAVTARFTRTRREAREWRAGLVTINPVSCSTVRVAAGGKRTRAFVQRPPHTMRNITRFHVYDTRMQSSPATYDSAVSGTALTIVGSNTRSSQGTIVSKRNNRAQRKTPCTAA
jgi:hypothetical protein